MPSSEVNPQCGCGRRVWPGRAFRRPGGDYFRWSAIRRRRCNKFPCSGDAKPESSKRKMLVDGRAGCVRRLPPPVADWFRPARAANFAAVTATGSRRTMPARTRPTRAGRSRRQKGPAGRSFLNQSMSKIANASGRAWRFDRTNSRSRNSSMKPLIVGLGEGIDVIVMVNFRDIPSRHCRPPGSGRCSCRRERNRRRAERRCRGSSRR